MKLYAQGYSLYFANSPVTETAVFPSSLRYHSQRVNCAPEGQITLRKHKQFSKSSRQLLWYIYAGRLLTVIRRLLITHNIAMLMQIGRTAQPVNQMTWRKMDNTAPPEISHANQSPGTRCRSRAAAARRKAIADVIARIGVRVLSRSP